MLGRANQTLNSIYVNNSRRSPFATSPANILPTTSDTPWRCYHLNTGGDVTLGTTPVDPAQINAKPTLEVCDFFSVVAPNDNRLYIFGGNGTSKGLRQVELDDVNSTALVRNIQVTGTPPSLRGYHSAVMIGGSLLIVWGGYAVDEDFHVFNLSEFNYRRISWLMR